MAARRPQSTTRRREGSVEAKMQSKEYFHISLENKKIRSGNEKISAGKSAGKSIKFPAGFPAEIFSDFPAEFPAGLFQPGNEKISDGKLAGK